MRLTISTLVIVTTAVDTSFLALAIVARTVGALHTRGKRFEKHSLLEMAKLAGRSHLDYTGGTSAFTPLIPRVVSAVSKPLNRGGEEEEGDGGKQEHCH